MLAFFLKLKLLSGTNLTSLTSVYKNFGSIEELKVLWLGRMGTVRVVACTRCDHKNYDADYERISGVADYDASFVIYDT